MESAPKMQNMGLDSKEEAYSRRHCGIVESADCHSESTPAYRVLNAHNLLDTRYRLETSSQIDAVPGNATRSGNLCLMSCCLPCWACGLFKTFAVSSGQVKKVEDGRGGFLFHGQGVHRICDPFYTVGKATTYQQGCIQHGDLTLVVVEQGYIGFALEKGQPVLLPPGMHQWRSTTMVFVKSYDLNNNVVRMGPLTLVTVDSGYCAVTEDNGQQKILAGGDIYLLTHRNWKFQKYMSQKIQSNNLKRIEATSADNVLMAVDATVIWRITDVSSAALNAGESIAKDGADTCPQDLRSIEKLQGDVLKQAEASLAAFIGAVNYSDTFNVAAAVQGSDTVLPGALLVAGRPVEAPGGGAAASAAGSAELPSQNRPTALRSSAMQPASSPLFDLGKMQTCLNHASAVTTTYGVTIMSINVVAAVPANKELMVSLAAGAVAAAEAQKFETVATGKASAAKIEARGSAEAEVFKARGEAEAERVRAEGHLQAAELLNKSQVAVKLAMIDRTGAALDDKKTFFFGADPKEMGGLLATSLFAGRS